MDLCKEVGVESDSKHVYKGHTSFAMEDNSLRSPSDMELKSVPVEDKTTVEVLIYHLAALSKNNLDLARKQKQKAKLKEFLNKVIDLANEELDEDVMSMFQDKDSTKKAKVGSVVCGFDSDTFDNNVEAVAASIIACAWGGLSL